MQSAPVMRPLGVGDILDRVFGIYRGRPLLFITLSAIPYLVLVLVILVLALVVFAAAVSTIGQRLGSEVSSGRFSPEFLGAVIAGFAFLLVVFVLAILLFSAQSASLVNAAAARYLSKETTIGKSFRAGLEAAPAVFGAGILVALLILAFYLGLILAGIVAALIGSALKADAITILAIIGLVVAGLVGTFYLAASWLLAPVVVVLEGVGPAHALRRSWGLANGHRWRILGIQILLTIIQVVLSTLISAIFVIGAQQNDVLGTVLQQLANFASTIVWAPVQWAAFTILYYDLRVRKEAFDLQVAAEALPAQS